MNTASYRGVVKGNSVILLQSSPVLPDGTEVLVTPLAPERGTAAAVLAAMAAEPHLSREDVAELEQAIAMGRRPLSRVDPFTKPPQPGPT